MVTRGEVLLLNVWRPGFHHPSHGLLLKEYIYIYTNKVRTNNIGQSNTDKITGSVIPRSNICIILLFGEMHVSKV